MSRSSTLKRWMPVLVLALLPVFHTMVAGAASAAAPMLGFTVTPAPPTTPPPTTPVITVTTVTRTMRQCIPVITKRVTPEIAGPGDEVIFTIEVSNQGDEKAVGAYVFDDIPEHLEVEDVVITPADQGTWEKTNSSQQVVVSLGTIGKDLGVVRIEIHARVRQDAPPKLCVENLAEFRAHNCPDRSAVIICTPPETGGTTPWWMVAGGLGVCVLVLGLALSKRERA